MSIRSAVMVLVVANFLETNIKCVGRSCLFCFIYINWTMLGSVFALFWNWQMLVCPNLICQLSKNVQRQMFEAAFVWPKLKWSNKLYIPDMMEEPFACTTYCRQYCTNSFVTIVAEMITSAKSWSVWQQNKWCLLLCCSASKCCSDNPLVLLLECHFF